MDNEKRYEELEEEIEKLEKQIDYERKKLDVCAYGKSDLYYLEGLEEKLEQLIEERDNLDI